MFYSIFNNKFDSTLLLDSNLNKPLDPENDIFYKSLLNEVDNKKLYNSIINIRDNKISLNNLSHTSYLLPWSLQEALNKTSFESTTDSCSRVSNDIKNNLTKYIKSVKKSSLISSYLLNLRLIGFCNRNDLIYRRLRDIYRSDNVINLICKINNKIVKYEGKLILFDIELNLLLMSQSIIYINNDVIVSIIY